MRQHEFRRVLDQVKPSRAQEDAMLRRLLSEAERTEQMPMKGTKKTAAVLLAAAVMELLDQRSVRLAGGGYRVE